MDKLFHCNTCDRNYNSYQSMWNHNKKFHTNIKLIFPPKPSKNPPETLQNPPKTLQKPPVSLSHISNELYYICEYCNKQFTRLDNMKRHELDRCKKKNQIIQENIQLKERLEKFENMETELIKFKDEMKILMTKQCKTHPKTLTKINNNLSNSNNNNNNGIINNNYIIQLGKEDLINSLSTKEQLNILNKKNECLSHIIKLVHFNDNYPQFKNVIITNSTNNIAYIYDEKEQKFMATTKDKMLDELIINRMSDIEEFYETNMNDIDMPTQTKIKSFIDKMESDNNFIKRKKQDIKLIIYNNKDKVSKEIVKNLEVVV